jgi:hypothetical protein
MMSTTVRPAAGVGPATSGERIAHLGVLDGAAAAYGLSAAITIVFNTVLAWIKDAYDPLNNFMAALTGHHWITHGIVNIVVFVVLGVILQKRGFSMDGTRLAWLLGGAVVVGGGGLALWFVLV